MIAKETYDIASNWLDQGANGLALGMRAYERMQLSGTFAPWSNQFEAMSYVSFAIIAGYLFLELKYGIKAVGAFVVSVGFIAMGAASLLPYRYRSEEHTSELQSRPHLVCRLLLEKKKHTTHTSNTA